jgi:hypothetical protein
MKASRATLPLRNLFPPLLVLAALVCLIPTARGSATLVVTNRWSLAQDSRYYLPNSGDPRGVGINPATGDVLIPSIQGGSNHVVVLSPVDGSELGNLSSYGVGGGAYKGVCLVGASDDGAIYACNLDSGSNFKIYRWPTEDYSGGTTSVVAYVGASGPTVTRIGDSFAVRGAGTNTQLIASGTGSSYFTIFTTTDGTNFTAHQIALPAGIAAGQAERGICFDSTNNAFFASKETGPAIHYIGFNLGAGTATWLGDFTAGQAWAGISVAYLTAFATNTVRVLAGVYDNGASAPGTHQLQVYDISNTNSPLLSTNSDFPTPVGSNGNETGGAAIGNGVIVGLDTANGLQALGISFQANVPASIATQPTDQTNVLAGGYTTFSVSASGSVPLKYQWCFTDTSFLGTNKVTWAVSTNATLNLTNLALTNAGYYSVVVTNGYGSQTSVLAVLNVLPSTQSTAFVPTWSKSPGSLFFLSANNTERGMAYNPVNGHLIVVSRTPTNGVHVLDSATGNYLRSLDMSAVGTTGTFPINMVGVGNDGGVYVANLDTAGTQYEIYRWADDSASTVATVAYGPADPGVLRIGDTFAVRGAGTGTELLAGSRDGTQVVLFNTTDGTTFSPNTIDVTTQPAGLAGLGIAWGAGTTFWTKSSGYQFRHITYDLIAGTNGLLETFAAGQLTDVAIGVDPVNNLVASIVPNTAGGVGTMRSIPDHLDLYDVDAVVNDPTGSTGPALIDQDVYPTDNINGNGTGAVAFDVAGGRLFALDTNNGLLGGKVVARIFEAKPDSNVVLSWTGPSKLLYSGNVVGPYSTNALATSPFTNTPVGAQYFRLAR